MQHRDGEEVAAWSDTREAANARRVTGGHPDPSLAAHLGRITAYASGTGLLDPRLDRPDLRRALSAFMTLRAPELLDRWIVALGRGFGIAESEWPRIKADQEAALARWAQHIADPENLETYLFLRSHTRRGFIAQFPASRFLAAQMRFVQLLAEDLDREYANDPARARAQREAALAFHPAGISLFSYDAIADAPALRDALVQQPQPPPSPPPP